MGAKSWAGALALKRAGPVSARVTLAESHHGAYGHKLSRAAIARSSTGRELRPTAPGRRRVAGTACGGRDALTGTRSRCTENDHRRAEVLVRRFYRSVGFDQEADRSRFCGHLAGRYTIQPHDRF